ncbi:MAG: bifunctional 5,10-methylenetetrahydrofolate dehydrogenase/5,10-methenyltetrahydrofolate cyclohydrolase [Candidatus Omnitrophica bacterium]|nr:bifunctional 5,10-methylenetetrahydrofolate dehydrogenase/5,10-methenyltetrahydrofolate cyclohydrolase [Candidatus Omnitrophota bacterium]
MTQILARNPMGVVLDGKAIAERLEKDIRREFGALGSGPIVLAIISFDSPASKLYFEAQRKAAIRLGIKVDPLEKQFPIGVHSFPFSTVTKEQIGNLIQFLNQNPGVHGIFVHQPLPPQINAQWISSIIDPRKDVEGIHPQNSARRFFAKARIGSCTALAVMELIDEALRLSGGSLEGKEAVVVGHSEIVGRPVGMLLLDRLATTTVCHIATKDLEKHVKRADVLVVAAGKPKLIKGEWVKSRSIVIDVGINVEEGKVVGDVEFDTAKERAAFISPVPGGVGPVTVMMVMKNTVEAFKLQRTGG